LPFKKQFIKWWWFPKGCIPLLACPIWVKYVELYTSPLWSLWQERHPFDSRRRFSAWSGQMKAPLFLGVRSGDPNIFHDSIILILTQTHMKLTIAFNMKSYWNSKLDLALKTSTLLFSKHQAPPVSSLERSPRRQKRRSGRRRRTFRQLGLWGSTGQISKKWEMMMYTKLFWGLVHL
jgi:hypothetical protein